MADIPTERVRLKANGQEIVINVSDFDSELHEYLKVKRKTEEKPKGE